MDEIKGIMEKHYCHKCKEYCSDGLFEYCSKCKGGIMEKERGKLKAKWLDYPSKEPDLGQEIIIAYNTAKGIKKEIVLWSFEVMANSSKKKDLKFKWI